MTKTKVVKGENFDIDLQAEINGQWETVVTIPCSSEEQHEKLSKGILDWGHYVMNETRCSP